MQTRTALGPAVTTVTETLDADSELSELVVGSTFVDTSTTRSPISLARSMMFRSVISMALCFLLSPASKKASLFLGWFI